MCVRAISTTLGTLSFTLAMGIIGVADVRAQDVVKVYGPLGPSPAIHEAGLVFGNKNNAKIEVVGGYAEEWRDEAAAKADLIFASAAFMMTDFVRDMALPVHEPSITPLYMRPSAILVRPGNPKDIKDFPDLLRAGMRVMVVNGSGQVGLWEDMAGQVGDVNTLRTLRKNIVLFATHSGEAVQMWDERKDIDAWITWNIWYMPLRDKATLVPVSEDYVVHRQCLIALTERGSNNPLAVRFVEFLQSPEAAEVFRSWGWLTPPVTDRPLRVQNDISIVCRIDSDNWKGDVGMGLTSLKGLLENYRAVGLPASEVHISAVFHGDASYWLLDDKSYAAFTQKPQPNPNKSLVRELIELGVSIELCAESMKEHGWTEADVLPRVKVVASAYPRIVDLELQGYAYIRF